MNPDLETRLFNRFEFYRPELPMTVSLMCFGFECGDGWFDLIWELSENLEKLEKKRLESIPVNEVAKSELGDINYKLNVVQVKEKMGDLHFYVDNANEEQYQLIQEYERKSVSICEQCGKQGKMYNDGWLYVACDECNNNRKHRKEPEEITESMTEYTKKIVNGLSKNGET